MLSSHQTVLLCVYPTTSVNPVSVLVLHPRERADYLHSREVTLLWSQTVRQRKPKPPQIIKVISK